MMIASMQNDQNDLLQAYCDAALDPTAAAEFELRMASNPVLRERYDQIMSLRQALRALPQDAPPKGLLERITSSLDAEHVRHRGWSWQAMAASALIGAALTGLVMLTIQRHSSLQEIAQQVVASHIRGLLAPQPFDVASSDRHTVKPWFTTRIPESPQIIDLAPQGFLLAGERVDVIGREPVATIVYRHAAHVISVTTLRQNQSLSSEMMAGYYVRSWGDHDFTYVAVSDLPAEDLVAFESAFKSGMSRQ